MQYAVTVDQLPALTGIVTAPQAALAMLCFDDRVNPLRVAGGNVYTDFADQLRQATFKFFPVITAIHGLVDTTVCASGMNKPGPATMVPHRGVQNPWIGRVHGKVPGAGVSADFQHLLPTFSTIGSSVYATFLIRTPDLALDRDPCDIRVLRMNPDAGNLAAFIQSNVRPVPAHIGGFVNAVTVTGGDAPDGRFTGTYVQHVDIRWATATAPMVPTLKCSSDRFSQVVPAFSVFPTPSPVAPM